MGCISSELVVKYLHYIAVPMARNVHLTVKHDPSPAAQMYPASLKGSVLTNFYKKN